ncbi:MAG: amino acid ABC transporter permease, partial [Bacillota bacterium]
MHFDFHVFASTLFSSVFVVPALITVGVTIGAMVMGIVLGFAGAFALLSGCAAVRFVAGLYVGIFRGVPAL